MVHEISSSAPYMLGILGFKWAPGERPASTLPIELICQEAVTVLYKGQSFRRDKELMHVEDGPVMISRHPQCLKDRWFAFFNMAGRILPPNWRRQRLFHKGSFVLFLVPKHLSTIILVRSVMGCDLWPTQLCQQKNCSVNAVIRAKHFEMVRIQINYAVKGAVLPV